MTLPMTGVCVRYFKSIRWAPDADALITEEQRTDSAARRWGPRLGRGVWTSEARITKQG